MSVQIQHPGEPFCEQPLETTRLTPNYRIDLRNARNLHPDRFLNANIVRDWSLLSWKEVGKPYQVENMSKTRTSWEKKQGKSMPAHTSWEYFNKSFHEWFEKNVPAEKSEAAKSFWKHVSGFNLKEVRYAFKDLMMIHLWNYAHRIQDGIWDPRGKRALFQGLDLDKPRILFLGAAEGYEAMQLQAMYPGGECVLVDYDEFCKTTRFGDFPETYPFLGTDSSTGQPKVWYKNEMNLYYLVEDIRDLSFGKEFDLIISVGLLEHFPDEYKPEVMDWHRKFLKPGGYAILTTPRNQPRSRIFYRVMEDVMNHTYRELMDIRQMGLYVYENGFDILRHGFIKVHNGIVACPR
ncbi:Methyltransferase domain protein [Paenibacillus larvae subsp. larvae]|uniref:Methyltransferase domain protein n=1 Tax=Paenibacillus larvae subsp. larvae TaxID=147375 RepID=A0A2L1UIY5_9BACL|nr:class I SAM-dependent methyltransferase [Paenibacillus larvae]AVF28371.1 Methyltransferase domain protein [Paenibacillus larvae subsp. larvae]AVF32874.1 Methyltransferase domain protein [Paenibacillus larvae subsp. larvae]MBH0340778.1 methyltransferase type 11 [Paenibacillus larvae]MCY7520086.1 methyltransferase domain-containing protein [Paenibacillus larvae]MCY9501127.1 methyltransferase domain-containing protein [Paenibacillus larvae]